MPVILGGNTGIYLASLAPSVDPDAQAFITAASITDPTQQSAINQLVVDLKGYNIWSKMKALYPFVGGTAAQHKWNLKDPRDLDAAFRLVFSGGWTHSVNGALPNGTNAYADTKLISQNVLSLNSTSIGVYSRTNSDVLAPSIANVTGGQANEASLFFRSSNTTFLRVNGANPATATTTDSRGLFIANRVNSTQINLSKNGVQTTYANNSNLLNNIPFLLGGYNGSSLYDNKQQAFAFIGDGLTSQNMTDLTTAVQAFQVTLGRSIGTQTVSDADAQAFVTNAGIVDQVEANAVNNLVIGLKADGLWTKMKAVYPMVGGSSTTMKFNLKNPLDTDAAFRLVFNGGWTFSSNGATPNGTNAFADTKYNLSTNSTTSNVSAGVYLRTNAVTAGTPIGAIDGTFLGLQITPKFTDNNTYYGANDSIATGSGNYVTNTQKLFITNREGAGTKKLYRDGVAINTATPTTNAAPNFTVYLGARNYAGTGNGYDSRELAFSFLGDTLTSTDVTNINTRVTTFQTALNRNV